MALTESQQALELIKKSRSVLIVFKKNWTPDALAGSLALLKALKKMDKRAEIVCEDFNGPAGLSFLGLSEVKNGISGLQKFIISVDTSQTKAGSFYFDNEEKKLNICVTPGDGQFKPEDVSTTVSGYKYDLIFIINSPDLDSLGEIYRNNSDFFQTTPKINIDNAYGNEHFGNLNFVDLTSASASEVVYDLIKQVDNNLIDSDIATYILAGIIAATKNFKVAHITAKTLNTAGELIAKGARREQIIQNLYQTRFLSTLKLWGRVLSRLNNDLNDKLVWSSISGQDFLETATTPDEIIDVIDELIVSMPKTEIIVLFYEEKGAVTCAVHSVKNIDSLFIAKKYHPVGNATIAKFQLYDMPLAKVEREVIEEIRQKLI